MRARPIRQLVQAPCGEGERLRCQQRMRRRRDRGGDRVVSRMMQPFDPHCIEPWPADTIPRAKRARRIVEHEQARAEHVDRVTIVWIDRQRLTRQRGGVVPLPFSETHARELAERTRRCGTLGANAAEDCVGFVQTALLNLDDRVIESAVTVRGVRL